MNIAINNLKISYNDEGPDGAPVIIFIHGFPLNKSMWNKQMEALKANYHVIAYDIRGHGNSDEGEEDFTIDLFVNDLLNLMNALKIEKTILCGLSMGGYIALNAIENYPERFDALILCDTNCLADLPEAKEKRMKAIESIKKNGVEKYADESIKKLFAPESFKSKNGEIDAVKEMIVKTSRLSLCNTLHALSERNETCNKLPEIKIPVLIMVGREDIITPPASASLMHEKIKGSFMHIIGHAGHLSNMENPSEFNDQLKKFLDKVCDKQLNNIHKMKNHSKENLALNQEPDKFQKDNPTERNGQNQEKGYSDKDAEADLNSKILKITLTISEQYPELSNFIEEMPVTIPNVKNPDITLKNLKTYYESLSLMLNKYKSEHPTNLQME